MRTAFEAAGAPWPVGNVKASLEVDDRRMFNERQAQPTSIDLVLQNDLGSALFVEAKFVEQEFGGCSVFEDGDCSGNNPAKKPSLCYLHQIGRTYWERMEQLGFLQPPMSDCRICPLASYYQFFRETVFAISNGGHFVLLSDDRSPVFFRRSGEGDSGLLEFLSSFVPMEHRCRVHAVTIQAIARAICHSRRHDDWISEFMNKYGIERE